MYSNSGLIVARRPISIPSVPKIEVAPAVKAPLPRRRGHSLSLIEKSFYLVNLAGFVLMTMAFAAELVTLAGG